MIKIRKATKKDLDIIVNFSSKLLLEHEKNFSDFPKLSKNFKKEIRKFMKKEVSKKNNVGFIAFENEKPIGFILGEEKKDYPVFAENERPTGHIGNFYVEPEFRKKGIGKKLFAELKKWFRKRKLKKAEVGVNTPNKKGKKLYKKLGFVPYDERWRLKL